MKREGRITFKDDGWAFISMRSPVTGDMNFQMLPITREQVEAWEGGQLIQDVMPHLTSDEREFLMNGMTKECWDILGGDNE